MSTKQEIGFAEKYLKQRTNDYVQYFLNIAHNSIVIDGLPINVPKRYFLRVLFKEGKIGHYNGLYLPASGVGVDLYGLPTEYVLYAYNGVSFTAESKDVGILRINDLSYPLYPYIKMQSRLLAEIDGAIRQNLTAVKVMRVFECKDQSTLLSLQNAWKAVQVGALCAFETKGQIVDKVNTHDTGAEYLCDKFIELRKEIMNETLRRLGIMTANTDKRERVQSKEVDACVGETIDNVYVMIDTFNYDAKVAGLPLRMRLNLRTEDYYALNEGQKERTENDR